METKVSYVAVGIFVLVLGAALIGGVLWISSGTAYRAAYETYVTYMSESVAGLSLSAPVRDHGVEVGQVRRIALAPLDPEQVELTLDIERGTPVKQDTFATLRTQGLTGIAFVELSGGSRGSPPLRALPGQPHPVIPSKPSFMLGLEKQVSALLANLDRTSERLNAIMDDDNRRSIAQTLRNLDRLSQTLAARSAAIDSSLADAARAMRDTARVTAELPELVERLQRSAVAFERMANEVGRASASASETLAGTTLPQVNALVGELRELTGSLQRFSGELERNPSVLLYGRPAPKPGPGER
ncbi:MAG: MlaD family protein [Betaproteobacteria bacterium]|nr:MlaD family protein [Betaproteobacteria bacterium]